MRNLLMGDLHFPSIDSVWDYQLREAREVFYNAYLEAFFTIAADMHISIGDLTHHGELSEFQQLQDWIKLYDRPDFHMVLGNHDVLSLSKTEIELKTGKPRYQVIQTKEAMLLFLDTTVEGQLHGFDIDRAQEEWLENQLQGEEDKPVLIFAHHPAPDSTDEAVPCQTDFMSMIKKYKKSGFYLNGHTHTHQILSKDGWHFIQTCDVLGHPSFRQLDIEDYTLYVRTIEVDDKRCQDAAQLLHDKLPFFHRPADHKIYLPNLVSDLSIPKN